MEILWQYKQWHSQGPAGSSVYGGGSSYSGAEEAKEETGLAVGVDCPSRAWYSSWVAMILDFNSFKQCDKNPVWL